MPKPLLNFAIFGELVFEEFYKKQIVYDKISAIITMKSVCEMKILRHSNGGKTS